jgi:hypothetical protein
MNWIKHIRSLFKYPGSDRNYWFFVRCNHCNEILKGRLDLYNHLSIQYGDVEKDNTYYCRKVMIGGNRCYKPIEVEFTFDSSKKLINRQINGGQFVTEEEYIQFTDSNK